jgi:hypothetical protein
MMNIHDSLEKLWGSTLTAIQWDITGDQFRLQVDVTESGTTRLFWLTVVGVSALEFSRGDRSSWDYSEITGIDLIEHDMKRVRLRIDIWSGSARVLVTGRSFAIQSVS